MLERQIQEAIQNLSESGDTSLCEKLIRTQGVQSPAFAQAAFEAGICRRCRLYRLPGMRQNDDASGTAE